MVQANGGNDTIDVIGSIVDSTIYGGQGTDYITGGGAATSITGSLISGNLGGDTIRRRHRFRLQHGDLRFRFCRYRYRHRLHFGWSSDHPDLHGLWRCWC